MPRTRLTRASGAGAARAIRLDGASARPGFLPGSRIVMMGSSRTLGARARARVFRRDELRFERRLGVSTGGFAEPASRCPFLTARRSTPRLLDRWLLRRYTVVVFESPEVSRSR